MALALGIIFGLSGHADSRSGIVDGYGCHRGPDKASYHCHQAQLPGARLSPKTIF
jgi:hypothetical protein